MADVKDFIKKGGSKVIKPSGLGFQSNVGGGAAIVTPSGQKVSQPSGGGGGGSVSIDAGDAPNQTPPPPDPLVEAGKKATDIQGQPIILKKLPTESQASYEQRLRSLGREQVATGRAALPRQSQIRQQQFRELPTSVAALPPKRTAFQKIKDVFRTSRFNPPISTVKGLKSAFTSDIEEFERQKIEREQDRLRQGEFQDVSTQFSAPTKSTIEAQEIREISVAELEQTPSKAAAEELKRRTQESIDTESSILIANVVDQIRPKYESASSLIQQEIQGKINTGELTLQQGRGELNERIELLEKSFQDEVKNITEPSLKKLADEEREKLKQSLERNLRSQTVAKLPVIAAGSVAGGVAFAALPSRAKLVAELAGSLFFAKETAEVARGVTTGEVSPTEAGLFGLQAGVGLVGFGAGAKIGNKVLGSTKINEAIGRSTVEAKIQSTGIDTVLKQLKLSPELVAEVNTLRRSGFKVDIIQTKLKAKNSQDAKLLPDVRGNFVVVSDQSGNIIRRISLGKVVLESKGKVYSQDILQKGLGVLNQGEANFENINIVGRLRRGDISKKFVPETAYKTLERSVAEGEIKLDTGEKAVTSRTTIERQGEILKRPKTFQTEDLFFSDGKRTPLGESRGVEIRKDLQETIGKTKPKPLGSDLEQTGVKATLFETRGKSVFEKPETDLFGKRKVKKSKPLFETKTEPAQELTPRSQPSRSKGTQQGVETKPLSENLKQGSRSTATQEQFTQQSAKSLFETATKTKQGQATGLATQLRTRQGQQLKQGQTSVTSLSQTTGLGVKTSQATGLGLNVKQSLALQQAQTQRPPLTVGEQGLVEPIKTGVPTVTLIGRQRETKSLLGGDEAFDVFVKRRGKFKKVAEDLPYGKALAFGARRVKGTLAATFKVRRDPTAKARGRDISFRPSRETFRGRVKQGREIQGEGLFIQRRGKRLSSLGERSEIQRSRGNSLFG